MDLEEEYGWLLDALEDYADNGTLEHYGTKGMKWGVRKKRAPGPELKSLGPQTITRKTKSGDELTLTQSPPTRLHKFMAKRSSSFRKEYESNAYFEVKDKNGKSIGEAEVAKRSKDELNLVWLGINKGERGKGYATAIMKASADFGKQAGFKKLTLEVPGNSPDARHIYTKLGFKVTKEVKDEKDGVWGGLTEMEYNFDAKHARGDNQLVIVALPAEDDIVRQYSSEKEPHLTLLYLGEANFTPAELAHAAEFIEHAASQISCFGLEVDRRGVLGESEADVLFFNKRWAKRLVQFRSHLIQDDVIGRAYLSADQFPEWTPHLTMGFPETPAKKDTREYQRFSYVRFDRIALWTGDSVGPTFQLKSDDYAEVSMTQSGESIAAAVLADLEDDAVQYGVPGMKWGRRKSGPGSGRPASKDSAQATKAAQIVKKSGVKALSNDDLKALVKRMDLEQQLGKLQPPSRTKKARMFVTKTLSNVGNQQLNMVLNQAVNQQMGNLLAKAAKK